MPSKAQETIELTFTANAQGGIYCPFDAVNVTNVTRGWTETLAYPDTVLVLNSTVGVDEQHHEEAMHLGEAYPNPFTDETNAPLDMPFTGEVSIQVVRIDGTVVTTSQNHLEAGSYRVKVSLSSPAMAFLVVTSTQGRQVVRMLCTKSGGRDSITLEPVSREYSPFIQLVRGSTSGEFQPGDMMRYTSVLFDGANTVYSNTITQPQYESEIITMLFDLTLPEVITSQVTNITQNTATGGGNVTATGGVSVTERGICWSTSHNPTISSSHASNGLGAGSYTVQMSGLTAGTTYFVRAYAINRFGTAYGNEVSFTTTQIPSYTISVSANPTNGGTVSGGGSYQQGQSCTVIATAANGYSFNNWTENGSVVSTNPNYSFTVNNNRSLVANFSVQAPNTYTINASPNPSNGGLVTGGGTYQQGQSCTVSAVANTGYTFLRWTENGNQVSTNANYTFTVTSNRTLVAQFQLQSFTISATVTPSNSGTVTGGGSYNYGQLCTLMATANTGYVFEKWTKNGTQISTEATYSFTVTESASYVAHFQLQNYTINVSANPTNGGSVTGGGSYSYGQSCTLTATANTGYSFMRWTENGNQVSTNASYTFTVTDNRFLVAQFQEQSYTITASANPTNGGNVAGGGSYNYGQSCTVSATAASGFTFTNWTENGSVVSTNANYTFTVNANRTLVANFSVQAPNTYSISVSSNPSNGGSVTGGGTYQQGQSCTVSATAATGFTFTNWTENGNQVSTNPSYTFTVSSNRALVANFTYNGGGNTPTGAINGLFSVSATQQVYFSQGNLQYQASSNNWRFATNQYDYIGSANSNISQTYNGWIDLFGWGTSGYNHGAVCYQPWSISQTTSDYYAYGSEIYNLYDQTGQADWGYNAISNGGNQTNQWRTLTTDEWQYVFNTRTTSSGLRYAKAKVNNVKGVILLPDNWSSSTYSLNNTNQGSASYSSNTISISQWSIIENAGAVFLPAAGYRRGTTASFVNSHGDYWSASFLDRNLACIVSFTGEYLYPLAGSSHYQGQAVRLVQDNPDLPTVTTNTITNVTQTSATGGGNVTNAGSSTVTARGVCWGTSHNPTVSGNHTTDGTGTGSFTSNITGLTANTMYYVRAFATNNAGTAYGSEVSFTTSAASTYTINVSANPSNGGSVTGGGTYQQGQSCTVSATANSGYTFVNWTENGNQVSSNANYTFTVNSNRTLVANFSSQAPSTYTISVSANPTNGGTVSGGGTYQQGQSCTVTASPNTGYAFGFWSVNNMQVSTNASYTFTVNGDCAFDAWFYTVPGVITDQVTNIQQTSATCGGYVTTSGGVGSIDITERGICWSTSHNPTTNDSHASNGTGMGHYLVNMTNLTANTTYYVRAYAINGAGIGYGEEVSFTTLQNATLPTVTTNPVTIYTQNSALGGGNVTSNGGATVTQRGVCWSMSHNPTIGDSHANSGTGTGEFMVSMMGLTPSTTYYVRAYATNSVGTAYGNEVSFTTYHDPALPTVTTSQVTNITQTSATGGGNVTSSGNSTVTERGICWSTSHNPMTNDSHLSSGNGTGSFSVNMTGLTVHTTYYVRAYAINDAGTVYGNEISFFTGTQCPIGAINSLFSVSATKQVWFSKGNLQYKASNGMWCFADYQENVIGGANSNISSSYSGWIDLFGWGTSGWNCGNTYYHPWDSDDSNGCLYGPPYGNYNLTGIYEDCDWGRYNAIYNGGNIAGQWRTLTKNEWVYLFETRNASTVNGIANARYAKAKVADMQGVILFPDSYMHPSSVAQPTGINETGNTGWNGNIYSISDFSLMQAAGAVFLPAAGSRVGTSVSGVGSVGCYWSASYDDIQFNNFNYGGCAYRVYFGHSHLETHSSGSHRYCGFSVRLVCDY